MYSLCLHVQNNVRREAPTHWMEVKRSQIESDQFRLRCSDHYTVFRVTSVSMLLNLPGSPPLLCSYLRSCLAEEQQQRPPRMSWQSGVGWAPGLMLVCACEHSPGPLSCGWAGLMFHWSQLPVNSWCVLSQSICGPAAPPRGSGLPLPLCHHRHL